MVGAGFSKNVVATMPGVGEMPLSGDIASAIYRSLFPDGVSDEELITAPLVLAEEYERVLGRGDIHRFCKG